MNDFVNFLLDNIKETYYLLLVLALRIFYDWKKTSMFQKIQNCFVGAILAILSGRFCNHLGYTDIERDIIVWTMGFFGMEALDFIYINSKKYWKNKIERNNNDK